VGRKKIDILHHRVIFDSLQYAITQHKQHQAGRRVGGMLAAGVIISRVA